MGYDLMRRIKRLERKLAMEKKVAVEPFTAVEFPRLHPPQSVADHEVLMSFNADADAGHFHDWWNSQGARAFAVFLNKQKRSK